jgi:uncharacterized protein (DUF2147 family)
MPANLKARLALLSLMLAGGSGSALAAGPIGTWIDHTGRGAVEIADCGGSLCGRIVWLADAQNNEVCKMQILGNIKPGAGASWDGGWIYDPESRRKYDVELTPMGGDRLRVLGYVGVKMFGESFTWKRAPADLGRCDETLPARPEAQEKTQTALSTVPPKPSVAEQAPATGVRKDATPEVRQEPAPEVSKEQPGRSASAAPVEPKANEPRFEAAQALSALGSLVEQRQIGPNKKECTIRIPDFARLSWPC